MRNIKNFFSNLPSGLVSYFNPVYKDYNEILLEVNPQLVKILKNYLLEKQSSVFVVYLCIANFRNLNNIAYSGTYKEIIRLFNKITIAHLNTDDFSNAEVITFHKISDDDFVIYFSLNPFFIQKTDIGNELAQELCFQLKLTIEQNLNSSIKHWFSNSLNITAGLSPIVFDKNNNNLSSQLCSHIVQAIKTSEYSPSTVKPIVYHLQKIIQKSRISIVYQPIVGIKTGEIIGYEALSRGPKNTRFASPNTLFSLAEENGVLYSLEKLCREQAIKKAQSFGHTRKLFLNINPQVINDPKFTGGITKEMLKEAGFTPQNLVFEITERTSIKDFVSFRNVLHHYRRQGYSVAIDDAGAGYSSLQAIAELKPDYIKIDTSLIRAIDQDPVKEALLETFILFSRKINAKLIAEGIERPEELHKLKELGVDFGQGFFLARPEYPPPALTYEATQVLLSSKLTKKETIRSSLNAVTEITHECPLIDPETTIGDVYDTFKDMPELEGLTIVKDGLPCGLIMRDKLFHDLASQHGFALYSKRPIKTLMNPDPLIVSHSLSIEKVAHLAMARSPKHLYDCVIVVDNGKTCGTICIRNLLDFINKRQIDLARNANPLTGLPGNMKIQEQLTTLINQGKEFSVIYLDLDNFKAYNDKYGFEQGDQAILLTSEILVKAADLCSLHRPFIGHIGGDDFIIVMEQIMHVDRLCQEIIRLFDLQIVSLYDEEDRVKGGITSKGRTNRKCFFPFMSISCAVVDNLNCRYQNHLQIGEVAAELKKFAKSKPGSTYIRNKRS